MIKRILHEICEHLHLLLSNVMRGTNSSHSLTPLAMLSISMSGQDDSNACHWEKGRGGEGLYIHILVP